MTTMTISLPEQMKRWIDSQVQSGGYSSASDYVRDLVRRDRERREAADKVYTIDELRILLAEARSSGKSGLTLSDVRETGKRVAALNGWLDGDR
jgi:antitoxin ParD1/3/4